MLLSHYRRSFSRQRLATRLGIGCRLVSLHDQMLAEAGSKWDDFRPFNIGALPEERMQFYHREIKRPIIQEYADEPWLC